jgi:predicted ATPase/DNA-binding winged helix-turn-helix (wHTH) protein
MHNQEGIMMSAQLSPRYCFDRFELQPGERRLLLGGAPLALAPRAFDLLLALVERAGQLVSKEALLERVWPKLVVEENNLQVQVSNLRKLLGQDAIATVAGQGYRFTRKLSENAASELADDGVVRPGEAAPRCRSNLPHTNASLIGRNAELAQLQALLRQNALVTVTGAGGVGKTRLTLEAAQAMLPQFPGGVWWVELASVTDPKLVAAALYGIMGGDASEIGVARQAFFRRLGDQAMLLLFDNCEHLVESVADLVQEIMHVAPQVRLLTTSQEVLGVDGEYVFRLPSLTLPHSQEPDLAEVMASDAVSLFVERARAAGWQGTCDAQNARLIANICRRLDGIALAIEMAAARLPMLGLSGLAQLLDERFRVLTIGRRGALPRHRTLHATLDWSYSLLLPTERVVFRRIACFVGNFTLAAATAVAADAELDQFEVIHCITSLVAKSLLVADFSGESARYRLLESTRAYAQEKLGEAGETPQLLRRAALHCQCVFKNCFDDWTRLSDSQFEARYLPELDNLRQALDWAFGPDGDPEVGLDLAGCSGQIWCIRYLMSEARERVSYALERVGPATPLAVRVELWLSASMIFYWRRSERVHSLSQQALLLAHELADPLRLGWALVLRACALILDGKHGGEPLLQQAQPLLVASKRTRLLSWWHKGCGLQTEISGYPHRAIGEYRTALDLANAAGADMQSLNAQENLADALWMAGDLEAALIEARAVVERGQQDGFRNKSSWGWMLGNLFGMLVERGQPQDLAESLGYGREAMPYMVESECVWIAMDHFALRQAKLGHWEAAAKLLGWVDATYHGKRQPNEQRAMDGTRSLLQENVGGAQLAQWLTEGGALSEQEAIHLALKV